MSTEGYIAKKKKGSSLYEELHLEGLEVLQKLSSAIWTDYNEHDPGVTLLENIAYAITELSHKTTLGIKDILISSKGEPLQSGDHGFFIARDILTTAPITFDDYRKLWIDQVANVKNVWIYSIDDYDTEINNTKGLLHVYVEKYEYSLNPDQNKKEDDRIIKEIENIYHKHRNLCEDLYDVEVYTPLTITVEFKITLANTKQGEEVLATLFHKINEYLAPGVRYYSLHALQKENVSVNEIFNGPQLSSGFIKDEDLKEPMKKIVISDLIKLISKIPGIININEFYLYYEDVKTKEKKIIKDTFDIPKHTTAIVLFPESNERLLFEHSGVFFKPDLSETKRQLSFIQSLDYEGFKAASDSSNSIPIPNGAYYDIESYYPLRKQFPELYGIGDRGISINSDALRKAQVKQLKGYLMPFDQLMVNFLAQLNNIYKLYDVDSDTYASYFSGLLPDIDQLQDLVETPKHADSSDEVDTYWKNEINTLNDRFDDHALKRLHQLTDHLLSRFHETFQTYSLSKINSNSYQEALSSERFEKELLASKRQLVQEYASISYTRAQSFNYQNALEVLNNQYPQFLPGAFRKIGILMGIKDIGIRSLAKNIQDSGIKVHPRTSNIDITIRQIDIETPFEEIEVIEVEKIEIQERVEDLSKVMHYVGDEDMILNDILKNGIISENYKIKKSKKDLYHVLYQRENKKSNIVHIARSHDLASAAIQKAIQYLVDVSQKSEGFFTIEHLLLLPPYHGKYFGFCFDFSLLNGELSLKLVHTQQTSCQKRDEIVTSIVNQLQKQQLQFKSVPKDGEYLLEVSSDNGKMLAISKETYSSQEQLQKMIMILENECSKYSINQLEEIVQCNVYYGKQPVDEQFFSFQMSFIAPSWPVRFQDENFRRIFENTVYEQIPFHIKSTVHWLDYDVIHLFETYYFKWLELLQKEDKVEARMYQAYQIITMLQELDKQ